MSQAIKDLDNISCTATISQSIAQNIPSESQNQPFRMPLENQVQPSDQSSESQMLARKTTRKGNQHVPCQYCKKTFFDKSTLSRHVKKCHENNYEKCRYCCKLMKNRNVHEKNCYMREIYSYTPEVPVLKDGKLVMETVENPLETAKYEATVGMYYPLLELVHRYSGYDGEATAVLVKEIKEILKGMYYNEIDEIWEQPFYHPTPAKPISHYEEMIKLSKTNPEEFERRKEEEKEEVKNIEYAHKSKLIDEVKEQRKYVWYLLEKFLSTLEKVPEEDMEKDGKEPEDIDDKATIAFTFISNCLMQDALRDIKECFDSEGIEFNAADLKANLEAKDPEEEDAEIPSVPRPKSFEYFKPRTIYLLKKYFKLAFQDQISHVGLTICPGCHRYFAQLKQHLCSKKSCEHCRRVFVAKKTIGEQVKFVCGLATFSFPEISSKEHYMEVLELFNRVNPLCFSSKKTLKFSEFSPLVQKAANICEDLAKKYNPPPVLREDKKTIDYRVNKLITEVNQMCTEEEKPLESPLEDSKQESFIEEKIPFAWEEMPFAKADCYSYASFMNPSLTGSKYSAEMSHNYIAKKPEKNIFDSDPNIEENFFAKPKSQHLSDIDQELEKLRKQDPKDKENEQKEEEITPEELSRMRFFNNTEKNYNEYIANKVDDYKQKKRLEKKQGTEDKDIFQPGEIEEYIKTLPSRNQYFNLCYARYRNEDKLDPANFQGLEYTKKDWLFDLGGYTQEYTKEDIQNIETVEELYEKYDIPGKNNKYNTDELAKFQEKLDIKNSVIWGCLSEYQWLEKDEIYALWKQLREKYNDATCLGNLAFQIELRAIVEEAKAKKQALEAAKKESSKPKENPYWNIRTTEEEGIVYTKKDTSKPGPVKNYELMKVACMNCIMGARRRSKPSQRAIEIAFEKGKGTKELADIYIEEEFDKFMKRREKEIVKERYEHFVASFPTPRFAKVALEDYRAYQNNKEMFQQLKGRFAQRKYKDKKNGDTSKFTELYQREFVGPMAELQKDIEDFERDYKDFNCPWFTYKPEFGLANFKGEEIRKRLEALAPKKEEKEQKEKEKDEGKGMEVEEKQGV